MSFVLPTGRRVGFWTGSDDVWSGSVIGGIQTPFTPQQFFDFYFGTAPFPAALFWPTGLSPSSSFVVTPAEESAWLSQLATICDSYPNIIITMLMFVNISGTSVATVSINTVPGFSFKRNNTVNDFTVLAGYLTPNTQYSIVLQDYTQTEYAPITTFTTLADGSATGTFTIPDISGASEAQLNASQGWFVAIAGTSLYEQTALQGDQTTDLTNYLNTIKGHPSIYGAQYEDEYFGNDATLTAKFASIISAAGYYNLPGVDDGSGPVMYYSEYPYLQGIIPAKLTHAIGINYGETGAPATGPIWTQSVVQNIVENTPANPCTILNCEADANNPAGDGLLWSSPTLRGWIANDPVYQSSFLLATSGATSPPPPTATPSTLTLGAQVTG